MENEQKKTVVIVHTVGKVASSTIYLAAKAFCRNTSVFHTHFLNEHRVAKVSATLEKHGKTLSGHIKDSRDVISHLVDESINFKVVTLIRDPIARDVSAFFENFEMFGFDKYNLPPVDIACEKFLKSYPDNSIDHWFENEFCLTFGINLFEHLFPKRLGWYAFEKENFDFLLLKAEITDHTKQAVVSAFLGCPDLRIGSENVMYDKFNPEYYSSFKRQLAYRLGDRVNYYNSEYIRFFYTKNEIDIFRSKWICNS